MSEKNSKFYIGIKALIQNEKGQLLLLKSGPEEKKYTKVDFWDIPGGRIQEDQSIEDTLRREVKEELDVDDIEIGDMFAATISKFGKNKNNDMYLMLIAYRCKLKAKNKFVLSGEHSEYKWATIPEAKHLLSVKFSKDFTDKLDEL